MFAGSGFRAKGTSLPLNETKTKLAGATDVEVRLMALERPLIVTMGEHAASRATLTCAQHHHGG